MQAPSTLAPPAGIAPLADPAARIAGTAIAAPPAPRVAEAPPLDATDDTIVSTLPSDGSLVDPPLPLQPPPEAPGWRSGFTLHGPARRPLLVLGAIALALALFLITLGAMAALRGGSDKPSKPPSSPSVSVPPPTAAPSPSPAPQPSSSATPTPTLRPGDGTITPVTPRPTPNP
ncbi:MAG TPA: hypothetical protein VIC35_09605 [Acidimicrobiia bacterium]|jgi:hypothetical protein